MATLGLSLIDMPDQNNNPDNNNINPILYVEVYKGEDEVSGQPTVDNSSRTPSAAVVDLYGRERQSVPIAGQPMVEKFFSYFLVL